MIWDLAVVGAGPAGTAAALGALHASPGLSVLLLDRADFPRDKSCGDGIAPHVIDVLASVGVSKLLDDWTPVRDLSLIRGSAQVRREMRRPAWVVPRAEFDARLVARAVAAGAVLRRQRVRTVSTGPTVPTAASMSVGGAAPDVVLDAGAPGAEVRARVVVAADGAHSMIRSALGLPPARRRALALRGYTPVTPERAGRQIMVFGASRQPSYAWSFDRGDGLANVGYGELLGAQRDAPSRAVMVEQLEDLLPGSTCDGHSWRGHHLPLSEAVWRQPDGRVLLAGDAAGLINPMTGEGIFYAVATGVLAGRSAAAAIAGGDPAAAGALHRRQVRGLLGAHLRHTAVTAALISRPALLDAGLAAAARSQRVFDALVEIGLGRGRVTAAVLAGLVRELPVPSVRRRATLG